MIKNYKFWMVINIVTISVSIFAIFSIIDHDNYLINMYRQELLKYQKRNINCSKDLVSSKETLDEIKNEKIRSLKEEYRLQGVTITAYSPSINETDSTPYKTAIMESPKVGWTCAVSRDLDYLLGKKIYIVSLGVFKVNDLMNKRFSKRVDLCMGKEDAINFGIEKKDVIIIGCK